MARGSCSVRRGEGGPKALDRKPDGGGHTGVSVLHGRFLQQLYNTFTGPLLSSLLLDSRGLYDQ